MATIFKKIVKGKPAEEKFFLGNEAVVRSALESGLDVYTYYPGIPSSEVGEIFVQREAFEALHNAEFIIDDLFRTIYQEMVSPATRHALGEFYTPAPLAQKMVEEIYRFGQYVLDPACGSGTFLIEILNLIYNSTKKDDAKVDAVSKIYGFDVNHIAVLVARSNLLLLTDKIFPKNNNIPINIFLTDSLNPINEFRCILGACKDYQ